MTQRELFILIALIALMLLLFLIQRSRREGFESPGWNDATLYNKLSKRIRIGVWQGWINLTGFRVLNEILQSANCDIQLFDTSRGALDALYVSKRVDTVFCSEAEYAFYIASAMQEGTATEFLDMSKKYIQSHTREISTKFPTRFLYSFFPIYQVFVADSLRIPEPNRIANRTIEMANTDNPANGFQTAVLETVPYMKYYASLDKGRDRVGPVQRVGMNTDAFFGQYDLPNESLQEYTRKTGIVFWDLWGKNESKIPFQSREVILSRFFYLQPYEMDLRPYPMVVERRRATPGIRADQLSTYGYRTLLITRAERDPDISDEAIYRFSKTLWQNRDRFDGIRQELNNPEVAALIPPHPARFK